MAKRPVLQELALVYPPSSYLYGNGTNDFSFNYIGTLSRLSAFRERARTTPASGSSILGWR